MFLNTYLLSQNKSGHQWLLEGFTQMDFTSGKLVIKTLTPTPSYGIGSHSTTYSDTLGNILLSTGGCFILNKKFKLLEGGDSINSSFTYRGWCKGNADGDFPLPQNNIILPFPDSPHLKIILNLDFNFAPDRSLPPVPYNIYYHIVDMTQNSGLGKVKEWKKVAISDTLSRGYIQAIKHKNGKNWWLLVPKLNSNCMLISEITSTGLSAPKKYCLGRPWINIDDASNQIDASPDGSMIARVSNRNYAMIYKFNNTDGSLSNPIELTFPIQDTIAYLRGICFSANSRYLYIASKYQLFQYDTKATNIQQSMKVVGDINNIPLTIEKGLLRFLKLAPDGKIYISGPISHRYLSVINRPNCPGILCDFKPHAVELPAFNYNGLPNNVIFEILPANYTCDSLPSPTQELPESITLSPNPTQGTININTTTAFDSYIIINAMGQAVQSGKWNAAQSEIDVAALPEGIYFVQLIHNQTHTHAIGRFVLKK
jgi:hypothetical protein